jgi:hypothetical protein
MKEVKRGEQPISPGNQLGNHPGLLALTLSFKESRPNAGFFHFESEQ